MFPDHAPAQATAPARLHRPRRVGLTLLLTAALASPAWAQPVAPESPWGDVSLSGFGSLVLGRTTGPCSDSLLGGDQAGPCTRFVADWAHGGVYRDRWSPKPETRAGLQADWSLTPTLSLTTQLTARTASRQPVHLEWAYATWQPSESWRFQVGRKRLPLYQFSDFQDVGLAFDTVRPSPDVYGWDIVNYNGLSAAYTHRQGALNLRAELLAGQERSTDNAFLGLFGARSRTLEWRDIRGLVLEASYEGWSGRVSHLDAQYRQVDASTGTLEVPASGPPQRFSGLALNRDWGPWVLRTEYGRTHRPALNYRAHFHLATLGYRWGQSTFTAGHNAYLERALDTGQRTYGHHGGLLAWRLELSPGTALKLQVDQLRDTSEPNPGAVSARLYSASYDFVF